MDLDESADRSLSPPIRQSTPRPEDQRAPALRTPDVSLQLAPPSPAASVSPLPYVPDGYYITFDSDAWRDLLTDLEGPPNLDTPVPEPVRPDADTTLSLPPRRM